MPTAATEQSIWSNHAHCRNWSIPNLSALPFYSFK